MPPWFSKPAGPLLAEAFEAALEILRFFSPWRVSRMSQRRPGALKLRFGRVKLRSGGSNRDLDRPAATAGGEPRIHGGRPFSGGFRSWVALAGHGRFPRGRGRMPCARGRMASGRGFLAGDPAAGLRPMAGGVRPGPRGLRPGFLRLRPWGGGSHPRKVALRPWTGGLEPWPDDADSGFHRARPGMRRLRPRTGCLELRLRRWRLRVQEVRPGPRRRGTRSGRMPPAAQARRRWKRGIKTL